MTGKMLNVTTGLQILDACSPARTLTKVNPNPKLNKNTTATNITTLHSQSASVSLRTGNVTLDEALDASNLWRSGSIIAVGSGSSTSVSSVGQGSMPIELVVQHLLSIPVEASQTADVEPGNVKRRRHDAASESSDEHTEATVFILAPSIEVKSTLNQIYRALLTALQKHRPLAENSGRDTSQTATSTNAQTLAKALLTHVSLLPYLDLSGLIESLVEVQSSIDDASSGTRNMFVLIQGLTAMTSASLKRGGPGMGSLMTTAIVSTILQSLRSLARSRSRGGVVVMVEINTIWTPSNVQPRRYPPLDSRTAGGANVNTPVYPGTSESFPALESAFVSARGNILRFDLGSALLCRVVEMGIDVVVGVHDGDGKFERTGTREGDGTRRIIEVVKDERLDEAKGIESCFGKWAAL